MTEQEIDQKVKNGYTSNVPNVQDQVLSECCNQKEKIIPISEIKSKKRMIKWVAGVSAMFVLLFAGLFGIHLCQANSHVDTIVSLDVNPSIEIEVDQNEKVLVDNPLNEDGKTVIDNMNFKGSDMETTINALLGSMLHNGYLNDSSNSKLQELADQYGISLRKAQLIQQYINQEPQYSFGDLVELTINELNLMSKINGISLEDIQLVGNISDKSYIGIDKAAEIALVQVCATSERDVSKLEVEMDYEHGVMIYEVSFFYENNKYNYGINANTGEIMEAKSNLVENKKTAETGKDKSSSDKNSTKNTDGTKKEDKNSNAASADYIGEEKAKEIALLRAQHNENEITEYNCETYIKMDISVYKIKFVSDKYQYSCDVNALTGEIVKYEKKAM